MNLNSSVPSNPATTDSQELLRNAAQSLAAAGFGDDAANGSQSIENEVADLQKLGLMNSTTETLEARAKRGRVGGLSEVLAMVPDVPPMPGDEK